MSISFVICFLYLHLSALEQTHYYAYDAVQDEYGVIAPWYTGLNGQWDYRVRIAGETLKRYPWAGKDKACTIAPEYVFNGTWSLSADGTISVPNLSDWDNGDLGQRSAYLLSGWVDYYRYTGDPSAIAHISILADFLLDYCVTSEDHSWPKFLISVPVKGKPYGHANAEGFIQLDIVAEVGIGLLHAYQLVGNERWLEAVKHWADLLAEKRSRNLGTPLWGRYANPEQVLWSDHMTGGIAFILTFFDELIKMGYTGQHNAVVEARDAGQTWLRDVLLPKWTVDDTWGRNYWDWEDPVQAENVTEFVVRYLISNPDVFPNWKNDARNILSLFLNRTSVCPNSRGDVYSGAWAYPESSGCCGRSLWYGPMELAPLWAEYGVKVNSPWATEVARRQAILTTYDCHENGIVEDNIDGGQIVAGGWFKIAHPMALKHVLNMMAWMPEICGANRENHILRTDSVVTYVEYGVGRVYYKTFNSLADNIDVLRLAFTPKSVGANGVALDRCEQLSQNGFTIKTLSNGDCIVQIRHDGCDEILIEGDDVQQIIPLKELNYSGDWQVSENMLMSSSQSAEVSCSFTGNQLRVIGKVTPDGGLADVYLDDVLQRVTIDCWTPNETREQQVLYYRNGLSQGQHTLRIVVKGIGNPLSKGASIYLQGIVYSSAEGSAGYGSGGGPTETQRMIFGYTSRQDYVDSQGNRWKPATEFVARLGTGMNIVRQAWITERTRFTILNTADPELYRYGVQAQEFWTNVTVAPGIYYVKLKFAETRNLPPEQRAVTIYINGIEKVKNMDISATAGGHNKAVDIIVNDIQPKNGIVEIRLKNEHQGLAILQALEVGQGNGGDGAQPIALIQ
ncbi:MAG TPA: malectin domain-containing carbohydrate-binding protein [Candidatus Hydrogenedens sp.]|nr:malectin domain-containing carbohydrate-binding protein [Candidatus Hydrogenedens sp.]HPP59998.1 malectin domain-containing carbohydrate-binding protein [Candidatus Hydrogenedens sp.]